MSQFTEYFLNSNRNIIRLELLEISHPSFSQVYRIVRNAIAGVTVTHEDATVHDYVYYPLALTPAASEDNLDQVMKISLGDLGELLPNELDRIQAAGTFDIKPTVTYRTYRSDDLTQPLDGPFNYEILNIPFNQDGASFEAGAPRLNQTSTGERYNNSRFQPLKGFL